MRVLLDSCRNLLWVGAILLLFLGIVKLGVAVDNAINHWRKPDKPHVTEACVREIVVETLVQESIIPPEE